MYIEVYDAVCSERVSVLNFKDWEVQKDEINLNVLIKRCQKFKSHYKGANLKVSWDFKENRGSISFLNKDGKKLCEDYYLDPFKVEE